MTPDERWRSRAVAGELTLSWHEDLTVEELDGGAVLLGRAVDTGGGADAATAITGWAGRWALVGADRLVTDSGSLLGSHVVRTEEGWWASSSPVLALRAAGLAAEPATGRRLRHGEAMDWFAPPMTGLRHVTRLLAGQSLALPGGEVVARQERPAPETVRGDPLDEVATRLVEAWHGLRDSPVWLALTAGHDSRVLLASAVAAGVEVVTYTFENPSMSRADREQPPALAAFAGVEHRFIGPRGRSRDAGHAFDAHSAGQHAGIDRRYVARGQWAQLPPDAVVVRGGAFETARHFYHGRLPAFDEPSATVMAGAVQAGFGLRDPLRIEGVHRWAQWAAAEPWPDVDWRDRFYLEQRVGGWLSGLEQALDVAAPERVHLGSCDAVLSALLAVPSSARIDSAHHVALVERLAPRLLALPPNPPERAPRRPLRVRARVAAGRLRRRLTGPRG